MPKRVTSALKELERLKAEYGEGVGRRKVELLRALAKRRLPRARDVLQLHEILCFLRAYPDDAELLAQVEHMLSRFDRRGDLRAHRQALINTGIAGTSIHFSFFAASACRLARRWGAHLTLDWEDFDRQDRLERLLSSLALYCETPGLDDAPFDVREWIMRLKGPHETDAAFLLRRFEQIDTGPFLREVLLDDLDIPLSLSPGPDTPSRTREKYAGVPVVFQTRPLCRARPSVPDDLHRAPKSVRSLSLREGRRLIDLARSAMATRSRDLDAFAHGDPNDVRLADCGGGLQLAYMGVVPERRLMLETLYGFLVLKNGAAVGYGTHTSLFGSSEVAFTVFDTFRSGEAARMYGHVLATSRHLFGIDTFRVDPYQLGQDNDDAIRSGAWWFYQKLGFRPRDPALLRIMRRELKRMKSNRSHRSSAATLKKLASADVFLHLGKPRDDVLGVLPLLNVGLRITAYLAGRFGFDRKKAETACAQEAAGLLGVRRLSEMSPGRRLAWRRWAPLILILPGIRRWPAEDKRALVSIVHAKGGRRESDYQSRFDCHHRLRRAIRTLAEGGMPTPNARKR